MKRKLAYLALVILALYGAMWIHALNTNPVYAEGFMIDRRVDHETDLVFQVAGIGSSMEPTIPEGSKVLVNYSRQPSPGDIIGFECIDRCYYDDGDDHNGRWDRAQNYGKRLIKIREDGAWWVEGDNKENSWDSIDYGWILPSERKNVGVVVEILK